MQKLILGMLMTSCLALAGYAWWSNQQKQHAGMVIVLNGPSGSGKTSLQQAFQQRMLPALWIKLGIDTLFDKPMPDVSLEALSDWQSPNAIRWIQTTQDADDHPIITLYTGIAGDRVVRAMNSAIAAYAQNGCNVIVDYIAYQPWWLEDLQEKLRPFKTYYVAIDIPLEALEERERARGTSPAGHARSHYKTVHGARRYDLRLDAGQYSAKELAEQLQRFIKNKKTGCSCCQK